MVQLEEALAFRKHPAVVSSGPSDCQRPQLWKPARHAADELSGIGRAPLKEVAQQRGAPMLVPLRPQAEPFVVVRINEIEGIIFLAEAQFVFEIADHRRLCDSDFVVCQVEPKRLLKLELS